jgi:hypothetical protein
MINIARWFAAYRLLEEQLKQERLAHAVTHQEAKEERQRLIDALARARGGSNVFAPLPPPEHPLLNKAAVGPTMTRARAAAERENAERHRRRPTEQEIDAALEAATKDKPSRPNGDAEPAEPIAPHDHQRINMPRDTQK